MEGERKSKKSAQRVSGLRAEQTLTESVRSTITDKSGLGVKRRRSGAEKRD